MPLPCRPRRQVDRRLGVRGEHEQGLAGLEIGEPALRERQRQRAGEAACVHGRHNRIVAPDSSYTLAAVFATADMQRLYSGLSLLVSAAVDGEACAALATFRSLELILDPGLGRLADDPDATPGLAWQGREKFARSLAELRDTALSLDSLAVFGCSASIDTMPLSASDVEDRLDGLMSTPRFLRETAGARLLFV